MFLIVVVKVFKLILTYNKSSKNNIQKHEVHRLLVAGPKEESYSKASNGKSIQNLVSALLKKSIKKQI